MAGVDAEHTDKRTANYVDMKIQRQTERRERFLTAFRSMPVFETWDTEDGKLSATYEMVDGRLALVEIGATRHHCKVIPRRLRRSMARELSRREYRAVRGIVNTPRHVEPPLYGFTQKKESKNALH